MMQCWSDPASYSPIAVDKTEGCYIHTKDGRTLFDLRSAHECVNLGFNHPKVQQAIIDQLTQRSIRSLMISLRSQPALLAQKTSLSYARFHK